MGCRMPGLGWLELRCSEGALLLTCAVLALQLKPREGPEESIVLNFFSGAAFLGLLTMYLLQ